MLFIIFFRPFGSPIVHSINFYRFQLRTIELTIWNSKNQQQKQQQTFNWNLSGIRDCNRSAALRTVFANNRFIFRDTGKTIKFKWNDLFSHLLTRLPSVKPITSHERISCGVRLNASDERENIEMKMRTHAFVGVSFSFLFRLYFGWADCFYRLSY